MSKFIENIKEMVISFIRNPKNGGIPAKERKFIKIKNEVNGVRLEKKNSFTFFIEERAKEKIIEREIAVYSEK